VRERLISSIFLVVAVALAVLVVVGALIGIAIMSLSIVIDGVRDRDPVGIVVGCLPAGLLIAGVLGLLSGVLKTIGV